MEDAIDLQRPGLHHITLNQLEGWVVQDARQVVSRTREEVIQANHLVACLQQVIAEMRANESSSTCYEYPHNLSPGLEIWPTHSGQAGPISIGGLTCLGPGAFGAGERAVAGRSVSFRELHTSSPRAIVPPRQETERRGTAHAFTKAICKTPETDRSSAISITTTESDP